MSAGFENAPVTLVLCAFTVALSLLVGNSDGIAFDLHGLSRGEIWRFISCQLIFTNMAETIVGVLLLYTCRQFERQLGIKKYGAFVFLSFMISLSLQLALTLFGALLGVHYVPSHGPYFLIFSLMPFYHTHIPKFHSSEYHLLGIGFSEKSWTYLLAGQLLLSDGLKSMGPSLVGLLIGYLYINKTSKFQTFRLPPAIESAFGVVGGFVASMLPMGYLPSENQRRNVRAPARDLNANQGARGAAAAGPTGLQDFRNAMQGLGQEFDRGLQGYGGFGGRAAAAATAPLAPPSEDAIASLTSLGFERAAVERALESTGNNVEAAANILLR